MSTILATGGLGFIGSHTCAVLLEQGSNVLAIDSLENSSEKVFSQINKILSLSSSNKKGRFEFIKGDVRNKDFLRTIFKKYKSSGQDIDSVIHFAGLKAVAESILNPLRYWDVNISTTISLLTIMDEFKCRNLIFSSSATVYKTKQILNKKLTEESDLLPMNPYGNTKLAIEKILSDISFSSPESWKIANLRYFNPVGAHSSGLIGENPLDKPNNLLPALIKVINTQEKNLSIFGNDWPTKDGTCVRDFIHVMDLAEAHSAALNFLLKNPPQNININIGTGKGTTVLELVESFMKINKCKIPYVFADRRPGDAPYSVADNSKALKLLEWEPKRTLKEICQDAWKWNLNHN